jgi:hypothetical protein
MTLPLKIEIETTERGLEVELFETTSFAAGETSIRLPDGSTVLYEGALIKKSFESSEILHLTINLAESVGIGVIANWLYAKLKRKRAKLRINRHEVEITPDRIRIVIEQIEKDNACSRNISQHPTAHTD